MIALDSIVEWTSSAGGTTVKKRGKVVEVVRACEQPQLYEALARQEVSYVVLARTLGDDGEPRGKDRLYWPRVSALREVAK